MIINVNGTNVLALCDQGCLQCSATSPASCAVCLPGYYFVNSTNNIRAHCMPCAAACLSCNSVNISICLSCYPGSFLAPNGSCISCASSCLSCNSINVTFCTSCASGSVLYNNGSCLPVSNEATCGQSCASCMQQSNGTFTCTICQPGFMMLQGSCVSCPIGCAQCSISKLGICTSCLIGYYYNSNAQNCQVCPQSNCLSCTANACLYCALGYMISPSLTCQQICLSPCATCSESDPSVCLSCVAGYIFNIQTTQNCQPDLSCNNNQTCSICPFSFALSVNSNNEATCVQCNSTC